MLLLSETLMFVHQLYVEGTSGTNVGDMSDLTLFVCFVIFNEMEMNSA